MSGDPKFTRRVRARARLERQFEAFGRLVPAMDGTLQRLRARGWIVVRVPIALIFTLGGVLSFLPILGLWMLPVGLMLLAVDLPFLRGPLAAMIVRWRRRLSIWQRWFRRKRRK